MDLSLVAKKLAFIETCVVELRSITDLREIQRDLRVRRFVEHTLQLAIQACIDVGSHLCSAWRLGEAETSADVFRRLVDHGRLDAGLGATLRLMVGLRNVLVHGYDEVNLAVVEDVLANRLGDFGLFVAAIRRGVLP
jgi:uncharacterized protein YutE (UPF0331/DUF86 family)